MKVAILFDRFGPYHIARLEAANEHVQVIPIEVSSETNEYQWDKVESAKLSKRITLFSQKDSREISSNELRQVLNRQLDALNPDVIAVNGWYDRSALLALSWCLSRNVPAVVMSESTAYDEQRKWWKEAIKKKIVSNFSAGLVGGKRHAEYLEKLGMPLQKVAYGYDVVDNNYFQQQSDLVRKNADFYRQKYGLPEHYFIAVSRFIGKKNLPFVIDAFHKYNQKVNGKGWDLFILGDGPLKGDLLKQVSDLKLTGKVHFEGFKQYHELPIYFGLAKAFIHASTTEQWGLVVNEAMASGLPVVVSERCGCVPELVHSGVNGFAIDPYNGEALTEIMRRFSSGEIDISQMGQESKKIVARLNADAFGKGLFSAAATAHKERKKKNFGSNLLIKMLASR